MIYILIAITFFIAGFWFGYIPEDRKPFNLTPNPQEDKK